MKKTLIVKGRKKDSIRFASCASTLIALIAGSNERLKLSSLWEIVVKTANNHFLIPFTTFII
jgi:hypothetical protein